MDESIVRVAQVVRGEVRDRIVLKAPRQFGLDMMGSCAIAASALRRVLNRLGHEAVFVVGFYDGMHHSWVELGDEVLDITATQFGDFPEVHVAPARPPYEHTLRGPRALTHVNGWWDRIAPAAWERETRAVVLGALATL